MKIAFLDVYNNRASIHKDPVTIPLGLKNLGHQAVLFSCDQSVTSAFEIASLPVVPWAQIAPDAWIKEGFDAAVVISRFSLELTPLLLAIKQAGVPLIVKGDTDGTLGYPVPPNYLRARPLLGHPANVLRHLKWRFPSRRLVGQKLTQIQLADRVVVESPGAAANVIRVMRYWRLESEVQKVAFIPNQISQAALDKPVQGHKDKLIMAIGRWEDMSCKGSDLLAEVIAELKSIRDDFKITIVGSGLNEIEKRISARLRPGIKLIGETNFDELQTMISRSRILLVTSRAESFSLVTAEALCAGASVAVTPIESLIYLAGGGNWGSVARDFSTPAITAAVLNEMERWDQGQHSPVEIAGFWRSRLNSQAISKQWSLLIEDTIRSRRTGT